MPTICVAAGCSNQKDNVQGTLLHEIPFFKDDCPEAKRRRKKRVGMANRESEVAAIEALGDMLHALQTRGF